MYKLSVIRHPRVFRNFLLFSIFFLSPILGFSQDAKVYVEPAQLDTLWVLVAAALVFLMQAGFKALEVGLVREMHASTVALKNMVDWIVVSMAFFLVGFGIMFGKTAGGIVGISHFAPLEFDPEGNHLGTVFFLFQLAFVGTSVTIVSGAMSERMGFVPYLTGSLFMAIIIYPVFGHWAWSSFFYSGNKGWLEVIGFRDFAGSTVVHSIGGWVSLIGLWTIGPRIGRFNREGRPNNFKPNNLSYAGLGFFLLWFGWWGFNGGSTLALTADVGKIILNTNLAGAAAALAAFIHAHYAQKGDAIFEKIIGGALGGLVAITASPDIQNAYTSIIIGIAAGVVHNVAFELLLKWKIDDAVGAVPVHGACGLLGTLMVVIAPQYYLTESGFNIMPAVNQLGVQIIGAVSAFLFAGGISYLVFLMLKKTVGLRVSPTEEREGYQLVHDKTKTANTNSDDLSDEDLAKMLEQMN